MKQTSTYPEDILIKECIAGNRKSQKTLYDLFAPRLFNLCLRYTHDKTLSEDILQEIFIKLFNNLHKYRHEGALAAWVRKIALNTIFEHTRRTKKLKPVPLNDQLPVEWRGVTGLERLYEKDFLTVSDKLSPGYKKVFYSYVVEGLSHKEIAAKMEISENTSKSQFCRAKNLLRKMVAAF